MYSLFKSQKIYKYLRVTILSWRRSQKKIAMRTLGKPWKKQEMEVANIFIITKKSFLEIEDTYGKMNTS